VTARHVHGAIRTETRPWQGCILTADEARHIDCSGAAHGGVTYVEHCACGAIRETESNGAHEISSGWHA
jgi:hypothetical protein